MAKRKAAPKYVWVSRPLHLPSVNVWLSKPRFHNGWWFTKASKESFVMELYLPIADRLFGVELEPGTCRRFEWRSPLVAIKRKGKVKA